MRAMRSTRRCDKASCSAARESTSAKEEAILGTKCAFGPGAGVLGDGAADPVAAGVEGDGGTDAWRIVYLMYLADSFAISCWISVQSELNKFHVYTTEAFEAVCPTHDPLHPLTVRIELLSGVEYLSKYRTAWGG